MHTGDTHPDGADGTTSSRDDSVWLAALVDGAVLGDLHKKSVYVCVCVCAF